MSRRLLAFASVALAAVAGRADDPTADEVAAWNEALRACMSYPQFVRTQVRPNPDHPGDVVVLYRRSTPTGPQGWAVSFPPRSVPLLVDAIRSGDGRSHLAALVAETMHATEAAPWLARREADVYSEPPGSSVFAAALVALGADASPHVRPFLDASKPRTVAGAARILGRIGDRESLPRLVSLLETTQDKDVLAAAAEAVRALDASTGAARLVDRLCLMPSPRYGMLEDHPGYADVREALCLYVPSALTAARARLATAATATERARLEGVVWDLSDVARAEAAYVEFDSRDEAPFGWRRRADDQPDAPRGRLLFWRPNDGTFDDPAPDALVLERAAGCARRDDLRRALDISSPHAPKVVGEALLGPWRDDHRALGVLHVLAADHPDVALDVVEATIDASPPWTSAADVDALFLLLDAPRTRALLERIVAAPYSSDRGELAARYGEARVNARQALRVLDGGQTLVGLLGAEDRELRLAAARALAWRGDEAGVAALATAAVGASQSDYVRLRDDLTRANKAPAMPTDDDVRLLVLHDAVAARIADPVAARAFDAALRRRRPYVLDHIGAQSYHFARGGELLAADVGAAARPLVEEAALFLHDRVATYALGYVGDQRSIPVLLVVAGDAPDDAIGALEQLGENGGAAALTVAVADGEPDVSRRRATRAARVEAALKALAETPPDEPAELTAWREWAARLLDEAASCGDARLVEPALRVVAAREVSGEVLGVAALRVLVELRDPRIVETCLQVLADDTLGASVMPGWAHRALVAQLGDQMCDFLKARIGRTQDRRVRRVFIDTLYRAAMEESRPAADRDFVAAALHAEMSQADARLVADAAWRLAVLDRDRPPAERDPVDAAVLVAWIAQTASPGETVFRLAERRVPGVGEAALASYRQGKDFYALMAVQTLGYAPAFEAVRAEFERRLDEPDDRRWPRGELHALARLGDEGRSYVRGLLAHAPAPRTRVCAATALAYAGDVESFGPAMSLLDESAPDGAGLDKPLAWYRMRLLEALGQLDPARADVEFVRRAVAAPEPALRSLCADAALTLRQMHPELVSPSDRAK